MPPAPFTLGDGGSGRRSSCGSAQTAARRAIVPPSRSSPGGKCFNQTSEFESVYKDTLSSDLLSWCFSYSYLPYNGCTN